uniref:NADH dehydrogenase subunit 6 n=1 Tax=Arrugada affinis TaxID=706857 RepID=UPI002E77B2A9|nr:NADH dehydrogenase subunit 6 [Arrugada affinis]WRK21424.1 NADH dehydrogenase subunit 6 [Arrugada affinis]
MKLLMMKMMIAIYTLMPLMKTPMSLGIALLIQTTISTILLSKMMDSSWISMIMFLMLVGGLLILFMYMSSIASNEKFKPSAKMLLITIIIMMPTMDEVLMNAMADDKAQISTQLETISFTKMYNKKTLSFTLMMFNYLMLTMIVITSIIKIYSGPLRSK